MNDAIMTADDIIKRNHGDLVISSAELGISVSTLRKYSSNEWLGRIIIIERSVYIFKCDMKPIDEPEWVTVDKNDIPLLHTGNRHKYKTTFENGKVVYWRRNK